MSNSKIEIKVGIVEFSGEGEPKWLSEQLDKILEKVPELLKIELASDEYKQPKSRDVSNPSPIQTATVSPKSDSSSQINSNLSNFMKETDSTKKQRRRFLAVAVWLQLKHGRKSMSTRDISTSLKEYQQSRLGNASEMLNQNVSKGFCEKDSSNNFYVTPEGITEIIG